MTLGRRKGSCVKQRLLHERRDAVTALLREGAPLIEICRRFDVSAKTFHRFRQADGEIDRLYRSRMRSGNCRPAAGKHPGEGMHKKERAARRGSPFRYGTGEGWITGFSRGCSRRTRRRHPCRALR